MKPYFTGRLDEPNKLHKDLKTGITFEFNRHAKISAK